MKLKKFWNWVESDEGRTLYLDGAIANETWYGDEVAPKMFKSELMSRSGDITVWINSPGGDVIAASQIYNMLNEYPDNVTVKIDGIAASAASVIAMAGSKVMMSPVSMLMVHNPMTMAFGDAMEMEKAIAMLSEVKESILNAYELKTGLSRAKLSHFMDAESWFNAKKAVELGFADEVMYEKDSQESHAIESAVFSKMTVLNSLKSKFPEKEKEKKTAIGELDKRLSLLKY